MGSLKRIKKLISFVKSQWNWLILGLCIMFSVAMLNIIIAQDCRLITDAALNVSKRGFVKTLCSLGIAVAIGFILKYFERYSIGRFSSGSLVALRDRFMQCVLNAQIAIMDAKHTGDILSIFSNDMNTVQGFLQSHLISIIYDSLVFLISFIYLFYMNKRITIAVVFIMPVVLLLSNYMTKSIGRASKTIQKELGETNTLVMDTIKGIAVVKAYNLKEMLSRKYAEKMNSIIKNGIKIDRNILSIDSIQTILQLLPYMVFALYGGYLSAKGEITTGELIAFLNLFDKLYMSLGNIPYDVADIRTDMASIDRILAIFELPQEHETTTNFIIDKSTAPILFQNVSFSYDGKNETVVNLSFHVENERHISIVGESGSGKSTLFKLLNGFYINYTGTIMIFGHELKEWDLRSLRNQISIVSQDTYLFPVSIEDNIRYGNPKASKEAIRQAAEKAFAHEFISKFPKGYDTILEEGGNNLSGGERQRISIARAILKDAPILLLDEATSSLDTTSKYYVQEALKNLEKGRTVLSISHRISTTQNSDEILVMKDGQIVQVGTYESLNTSEGCFKQLQSAYVNKEKMKQREESIC